MIIDAISNGIVIDHITAGKAMYLYKVLELDKLEDVYKRQLEEELRRIRENACVHVHPYGAISVGQKGEQLADLDAMVPEVIAFSDDGKGVQSESLMREAMEQCRRLGKILAAHCEDNRLLRGGYIHAGAYAKTHSHRGICSESEWGQIARDVRLAEETGCAYHVCHVSTKESVSIPTSRCFAMKSNRCIKNFMIFRKRMWYRIY